MSSTAPDSAFEERRRSVERLMFACVPVWTSFLFVDLYTARVVAPHAELFRWLASWRLVGVACLIAGYAWSRRRGLTDASLTAIETACALACATLVPIMATRYGGLNSPYMHGVALVALFRAGARPAPWKKAIVISSAIVLTVPVTLGAAARSRLFVNLSHDLRTPLAVIRGEAELLASGLRDELEHAALARIQANSQEAADLVSQLLELARLDAGRTPRSASALDVLELAREVAAQLQPSRPSPKIDITCSGVAAIAHADPAHVRRVLTNLVANAIRSLREHGGGVALVVSEAAPPGVIIDIIDDGSGIPLERRAKLFERFASSESESGTASGIGLALARELTVLNGGTLALVETPKTTFRLTLPAHTATSAATVAPPPRVTASAHVPSRPVIAPPTGDRPRLLVVEDHPDMRQLLIRLLEGRFDIEACGSVAEAKRAISAHAPRAILSDVLLPDGDAYDVLAYARTRPELAAAPIVLVSALADAEERVRGLAAGADDYLSKPFDGHELCARVVSAIERAEAHRGALAEQRREMFDEVHDGVSASLSRALLLLADPRTHEGRTEGVVSAIRDGIAEVRAIMSRLVVATPRWDALVVELRREMGDALEDAGIGLTFVAPDRSAGEQISGTIAHHLRRVAREATTNVLKHAAAKHVRCKIEIDEAMVSMRIEDDGRGMRGATPGRGLSIIARRARQHGGTARHGDCPEGGTFTEVVFPATSSVKHGATR